MLNNPSHHSFVIATLWASWALATIIFCNHNVLVNALFVGTTSLAICREYRVVKLEITDYGISALSVLAYGILLHHDLNEMIRDGVNSGAISLQQFENGGHLVLHTVLLVVWAATLISKLPFTKLAIAEKRIIQIETICYSCGIPIEPSYAIQAIVGTLEWHTHN